MLIAVGTFRLESSQLSLLRGSKGAVKTKFKVNHTIYTRNNMGQKCEGNCGLWVLNKILKKTYPEILKKIVRAVWEIPAK